jgi:hypothetical protein
MKQLELLARGLSRRSALEFWHGRLTLELGHECAVAIRTERMTVRKTVSRERGTGDE